MVAAFALSAPLTATASTWVVDNCNGDDDSSGNIGAKTGTLRFTIKNAADGDTIDVSQIGCPQSKISLTTGEIFVSQPSLTILGPGISGLTIDGTGLPGGPTGPDNSRPFTHTGTGTFELDSLRVSGGHVYHASYGYPSRGGCVYSKGKVYLLDAEVSNCSAESFGDAAKGGGVYALDNVTMKYSTLSGNTALGATTAHGGGAFTTAGFGAKYSAVDGNKVNGPNGPGTASTDYKYATGGGVYAKGSVEFKRSTISDNYASGSFGGIHALGTLVSAANNTLSLYSSTISGNQAGKFNGGVYTNAGTVKLYNSTIAFNTAGIGHVGSSPIYFIGPGLALSGALTAMNVTLQSSLLSNNTYGSSAEFDLTTSNSTNQDTFFHTITFNGDSADPANNLIRTSIVQDSAHKLPAGTQFSVCPLLGPLRDNGGLTLTHALQSKSPAIDAGNNILNYNEDQRQTGADTIPYPYPRVSNGQADIGAYEVNQDDIIYNSGFEGCSIVI
ncbi:MAG TPA: choice-of-anchor Q domain-containing protein [Rudaea sp.]